MTNLFVRKLRCHLEIPEHESNQSATLPVRRHTIAARRPLEFCKSRHQYVHQIETGYAFKFRQFADGRRQIIGFLLPGDFIDLRKYLLPPRQISTATISELSVCSYPFADVMELIESSPAVAKAVWRTLLSEEGTTQEWLVSLGQRNALERLAHLFCELYVRSLLMASQDGDEFELPATQLELGDAMGLSTVHVNRTLKEIRARELIAIHQHRVRVLNLPELTELALFSPEYLLLRPNALPSSMATRMAADE